MTAAGSAFVSYSHRDAEFVERLTADLRNAGIEVWRDLENIAAGSNWRDQIADALDAASVLIFVVSKNSLASDWIQHEVSAFLKAGKTIIPVVLDDQAAASLPTEVRKFQWVDFRRGYSALLVAHIVEALTRLGFRKQSNPDPSPQRSDKSKGYVFISYAEEDSDFVDELKLYLAKRGYAYWDYSESDRDYHTQLFRELEGVIREARATLSVLSEAWKQSRWTIREYFFSDEVGVPVFLLRAKPIGPTLAIAGAPYIDFVDSRTRGFERLDRELQRKGL